MPASRLKDRGKENQSFSLNFKVSYNSAFLRYNLLILLIIQYESINKCSKLHHV